MITKTTNSEINNSLKIEHAGALIIRYGLAMVLLWVGMLKFTSYEAEGIKPLVENSPILSWGYSVATIYGFSMAIGIIEILLGILIACRSFSPLLCAIGSIGAGILFLITLTFILSTPGVWQSGYGFPFLSPMPGQFIAKDLLYLGAAVWSAGEAMTAARLVSHTK